MVHSLLLAAAGALVWHPGPDWVEKPDPVASVHARKGGIVRFNGTQPPKSFNAYVDGNTYSQMMFSLMYEQLVATDPATLEFVPAIARRWAVSEDGMEYTFEIDEAAMWSDGVPVTAGDVKWTFDQVMLETSESGSWKVVLGAFESPEVLDADAPRPRLVRFRKQGGAPRNWRDLLHCGTFWVLPRHAFEGSEFNRIDFLGAPVSGPYRLARIDEQVETEYERVPGWWRAERPSCRGTCNFDRILMRYYVDNENAFAALKKRRIDVYPVYTARIMAMETVGEKFEKNWVLKRRVNNHEPVGYQGFAMNMRRWPFDDLRVRRAMAKLIDREMMNRTMMFNEYFLQRSFFQDLYDSEHACPNEFIGYDFEGAKQLLEEAGFRQDPQTGKLEQNGRPFTFTFLSRSSTEDKFLTPFVENLRRLGIEMDIKRKDFAGWMRDMDSFEFDMTWQSWSATLFRNPETSWLSREADRQHSNNTVGFKSAAVDRLIEAEKTMETVAERNAAYREIDRLVTAECPYAFLWNIAAKRLLYWNKFGMPDTVLPKYDNEAGVLTYWWYDSDRAEELEAAMDRGTCLPPVPETVDFDQVMEQRR